MLMLSKSKKFIRKIRKKEKKKNTSTFTLLAGTTIIDKELLPLQKYSFAQPDPSGYTICTELLNTCNDVSYIPNSHTLVVTDESFCNLIQQTDKFIDNVAVALNVEPNQAVNEISNFFADKTLLVQQTGVQNYLYKAGTFTQTAGSATMVSRTITMAKAAGVTGLNIIKAQPLMVITLPTLGGMFFHGCGALAGNNTVGRTCNTIGNILNIPMAFTESIYNTYGAPVINRVIGVPTVLNYTKQVLRGPGLDSQEALHLLTEGEKVSIPKLIKCWIIEKLGGTCK